MASFQFVVFYPLAGKSYLTLGLQCFKLLLASNTVMLPWNLFGRGRPIANAAQLLGPVKFFGVVLSRLPHMVKYYQIFQLSSGI